MGTFVNVDNYARAEVASQLDRFLPWRGGEVNRWSHTKVPTPLDKQNVIRMNRDTLYSFCIVDISQGATLTMPDASGRYMTVMVINEDGYINRVFHEAGQHSLTVEEFDTPFVLAAARTLADPTDADDIGLANRLQEGLGISAASDRPWTNGPIRRGELSSDQEGALLELGHGLRDSQANVRVQRACGPGSLPHRLRLGFRWASRRGGLLRHQGAGLTGGPLPTDRQGPSSGWILVGLDLQQGRLTSRRTSTTPTASTA